MGTIADKFSYLDDTKTAIRDAIIAKGVDIPEGTPFRQYAEKIREIKSGSIIKTAKITFLSDNPQTFYVKNGVVNTRTDSFYGEDVVDIESIIVTRSAASFSSITGSVELLHSGPSSFGEGTIEVYRVYGDCIA